MKRLFYRGALLILLVIAVDFFLGAALSKIYSRVKSGPYYKVNYAVTKCKEEVLFFGASETIHHIISNRIQDSVGLTCYNLGFDGQNILYQYALLQQILKRYTPKIVVLGFTTIEDKNSTAATLLPYCNSYPEMKEIVLDNVPEERYKLLSKTYPYNSLLFRIIHGCVYSEPKTNGYTALKGSNPHLALVTNPDPILKSSKSISYFIKFIELSKKSGCRVYLFQAPRYQINNDPGDQQLYKSFCEDYKITPLNFATDTTFLNNVQLFKDRGHLNNTGAEILTDKIIFKLRADIKKVIDL